ncbi:hypothetical protein J2Z69_002847 [Paenibacillus shirakamiensis]|uniref:Spore protein n=1 Tax=Paenibacillus shirakamiensis TaxID=1265935 RepID=A0ABS4JLE8_9BACL|nr:alpha/beta-type small acid-soluble spore protein [Paenibacillus shirakamiensis]MBP2001791.1 hypothetical protein [Paenibacillus shirakamiensis]
MARNNRQIIPQSRDVLRQWKYEIAEEFGLPVGYGASNNNYGDTEFAGELGSIVSGHTTSSWGHLTSRENGSVGGEITKRLVQHAEKHFTL